MGFSASTSSQADQFLLSLQTLSEIVKDSIFPFAFHIGAIALKGKSDL